MFRELLDRLIKPRASPEQEFEAYLEACILPELKSRADELEVTKEQTVEALRRRREISDIVAEAFMAVPREEFVHPRLREFAYWDCPLPICYDQTISQPTLVLKMLTRLEVNHSNRILEVGAGSGYAAALLGKLAAKVVATEIVPELTRQATERMQKLGLDNVSVIHTKYGQTGYAEGAPYERILVSASAPDIPEELVAQLSIGGIMLLPRVFNLEDGHRPFDAQKPPRQAVFLYRKAKQRVINEEVAMFPVLFVPLKYGTWR